MKLIRTLSVALLVNLCAATLSSAQMAPTKVAIVNPAKVFNDIQETKDVQSAMEQKGKDINAERFGRETKLKDMQAALETLKPDAPQYNEKRNELLQKSIEYKVWIELTTSQVQSQQKMQMKSLFDKITDAVGQVAQAKGIDLVVAEQRPQFPDNLDQVDLNQMRALLNSRNVLFNSPQVDITNDVIAAMDAKYKSGK